MPKVKSFSERFNQDNSNQDESNLSLIENNQIDNLINNPVDNSNDEVNFNSQDELTQSLAILENITGIRSGLLVDRILSNALLDQDDNFHLIKLFRTILRDEKVKLNEIRLKELEKAKSQKLMEMKQLELETLAYSLAIR